MARIPVFESTSRVAPMPGVRQSNAGVTPSAFGAAEGQALSNLGRELEGIGAQMRERSDKIAAKEAFAKASDRLREYLHDPDKGAYSQQGANAKGLLGKAETDLEKIRNESAKGLSPMQRELFESFWLSQRENALTGISRHESNQMQEYEQKLDASIVAGAEEDMATHYRDPEGLKADRAMADATIRSQAKRLGWSPEQTERALQDSYSRGYGAVIARHIVDGDFEAAQKVLGEHGDKMNEDVRRNLDEQIKTKSIEVFGQAQADARAPFGTSLDKEGDVLTKLNEDYQAGKMTASQYRAAQTAIEARFADIDRIEKREVDGEFSTKQTEIRQAGSYGAALKLINQSKNAKVIPLLMAFAKDIYPDEYRHIQRSQAISDNIALSRATEADRDKRQDAKAVKLQTEYEKVVEATKTNPAAIDDYISKNYSGEFEEELRGYTYNSRALDRRSMQAETKMAPATAALLVSNALSDTREIIDRNQAANTPLTAQQAQLAYYQILVDRNLVEASTADDMRFIEQYAAGSGASQFLKQEAVIEAFAAATERSALPDKDKQAEFQKYPGLFEAVQRRLGSSLTKPATPEQLKPVIASLMVEYERNQRTYYGIPGVSYVVNKFVTNDTFVKQNEAAAQDTAKITEIFGPSGVGINHLEYLRWLETGGDGIMAPVDWRKKSPEQIRQGFRQFLAKRSKTGTKDKK